MINYVLCGCRTLGRICNPAAQNISICNAKGYFFGLNHQRRRTFTPAEVQLIYAEIGEP